MGPLLGTGSLFERRWRSIRAPSLPPLASCPRLTVQLYVHPDRQRQGVGGALLNHALAAAPTFAISNVLAIVFGHNQASIGLLESAGFERWGHMPEVNRMPEGLRDVVILGRKVVPD